MWSAFAARRNLGRRAMTRTEFEDLVESALKKLPRPFRQKLKNIAVVVEDWADDETMEDIEQGE